MYLDAWNQRTAAASQAGLCATCDLTAVIDNAICLTCLQIMHPNTGRGRIVRNIEALTCVLSPYGPDQGHSLFFLGSSRLAGPAVLIFSINGDRFSVGLAFKSCNLASDACMSDMQHGHPNELHGSYLFLQAQATHILGRAHRCVLPEAWWH